MRTILVITLLSINSAGAAEINATIRNGEVTFKNGDEVIAVYRYEGTVPDEKGTGTKPLAKPYFWPLNAPGGIPVTRAWPLKRGTPGESTDHFHQKSAWFGHGDVIPHGLELKTRTKDKNVKGVDFWTENEGHGRIVVRNERLTRGEDGNVTLSCTCDWRTADDVTILYVRQFITIRATGRGDLIDFVLELKASAHAITFGDTKEGTFAVHVADELNLKQEGRGVATSSDGKSVAAPAKDDLPIWGQVADWQDFSGLVNGKPVGIAVFAHPKNETTSAWHTRAYGLLAANPFGRELSKFPAMKGKTEPVKLEPRKALLLRYAIYTHTGDAKIGQVAEAFKKWSEPK